MDGCRLSAGDATALRDREMVHEDQFSELKTIKLKICISPGSVPRILTSGGGDNDDEEW